MRRLLILSCSQRKVSNPDLLPAIERYDGPLFRVLRRWRRKHSPESLDVYILSAKFGLISQNRLIPNYDQPMTKHIAHNMQTQVFSDLFEILTASHYEALCICMGQTYRQVLAGYEDLVSSEVNITICSGPLGKMQSMLYDWLYDGLTETPKRLVSVDSLGTARIRGIEITLSSDQILKLAREALAAEEEMVNMRRRPSSRYQSWYVQVDRCQVAPKWLVSQLTGLPVSAFVTDEARRVLMQLGIEVIRT